MRLIQTTNTLRGMAEASDLPQLPLCSCAVLCSADLIKHRALTMKFWSVLILL